MAASAPETSSVRFYDQGFSFSKPGDYHLSLQLGTDALYTAVLHKKDNSYIGIEDFIFENALNINNAIHQAKDLLEKEKLFSMKFNSVSLGLINHDSTLVPNAVFEESRINDYLNFNAKPENGEVKFDNVVNINGKNIYHLPNGLLDLFQNKYPGINLYHFSTPLIENLLAISSGNKEQQVFVHIQYRHFEIIVIEDKKLRFYNSFQYQTSEDLIYYLLFVFEQLNIDRNTAKVSILGEVKKGDTVYSIMYKYIKNLNFVNRLDNFTYNPALNEVPGHFYFNIFSQYLCE